MQLAVDKITNDLILAEGGGVLRVDDGRYVIQLVKHRLQTSIGEWLLDPNVGFINLSYFEKGPDLFKIELKARQIILSTPNVKLVEEIKLTLEKRVLTIDFKAITTFGSISLSVPWSK